MKKFVNLNSCEMDDFMQRSDCFNSSNEKNELRFEFHNFADVRTYVYLYMIEQFRTE